MLSVVKICDIVGNPLIDAVIVAILFALVWFDNVKFCILVSSPFNLVYKAVMFVASVDYLP